MHRLGAFVLAAAFGLAIAVAGLFYVWGAYALAVSATQWIAGLLGEAVAAFIVAGLLVVGCLLAAQAAVWARARWDERAGAARVARRRREIDAVGRDPALAHWAPLAQRRQVADAATVARWEARYRELLAHPRRRAFAARALDGEFPSDAQIDFLLDDRARATCAHLQPVERALREAHAPMTPGPPGVLWTDFALDGPRLIEQFALAGVRWEEPPTHPRDPEPGHLVCDACRSCIESGFGPLFPPPA
jgi:hypothetical protein